MHNKLILIMISSGILLIGITSQGPALVKATYNSPAMVTADSSDVVTSVPLINNTPAISILRNQKDCQAENDIKTGLQMPVFIPDSSLTASMPIFTPPPVDEKMIIPFHQPSKNQCR